MLAVCLPIVLFFVAFLVDTSGDSDQVARGVNLAGENLSGFSREEAAAAVQALADRFNDIPVDISGPGDLTMRASPAQIGLGLDAQGTYNAVMAAGGIGSGILQPVRWVRSFSDSINVEAAVTLDVTKSQAIIDEIAALVEVEPGTPTFELENGELVGIIGAPGKELDRQALVSSLSAELPTTSTSSISLIAPLLDVPPIITAAQLQTFVDEFNSLTISPFRLTAGETTRSFEPAEVRSWIRLSSEGDPAVNNGLTMGLDEELVQKAVAERFGDVATLPNLDGLQIVDDVPTLGDGAPQICCGPVSDIILDGIENRETEIDLPLIDGGDQALIDLGIIELVGEFTTEHPAGQDRVINIQKMADIVRGVVLKPGEEFSVNDHVGRRTIEKGFVSAGVINYGVLDTDVGGGVSQFATTMFNAAYFAGFDILDYQMHSIYFSRYPFGREATLSFPQIDLRIRNPSDHHFLIWTEYTDTSITVKLFGTTFADVNDLGAERWASGLCTAARSTRIRTFDDGDVVEDRFNALYQPQEGQDCNGNSTLPTPVCSGTQQLIDNVCVDIVATCNPGEIAVDIDDDGYADRCDLVGLICSANEYAQDTDGDGYGDVCVAAVGVTCAVGQVAVDSNGDGVTDTCNTPATIVCGQGFTPVDLNNDGIFDECQSG